LRGAERAQALQSRARLRDKKTRPMTEQIRKWLEAQRALPKDPLGKAVSYTLNHWKGLVEFVDEPILPIDNNPVERMLRAPVVGRKNHYGSRSERGTKVAAIFYTLLQTAKLAGENPRDYLLRAARAAVDNPGTVTLPRGVDDGFG
jgi:transposase